jgi:hypothetical protein
MCLENYQEVRVSKSEEIGTAVRVNRGGAIALQNGEALKRRFPKWEQKFGST